MQQNKEGGGRPKTNSRLYWYFYPPPPILFYVSLWLTHMCHVRVFMEDPYFQMIDILFRSARAAEACITSTGVFHSTPCLEEFLQQFLFEKLRKRVWKKSSMNSCLCCIEIEDRRIKRPKEIYTRIMELFYLVTMEECLYWGLVEMPLLSENITWKKTMLIKSARSFFEEKTFYLGF